MSLHANAKRRAGHHLAREVIDILQGRPSPSVRAAIVADDLLTWMRSEVAAGRTDWLVRQPAKTSSAAREPD